MKLTTEQIEKLASANNVKRIAVENYLSSLTGNYMNDNINLDTDARLYKWNTPTINAIRKGIKIFYS